MLQYILKCSLCLAACWIFYQLVLRRLTFYTWNRWYQLAGSLLALLLPLVNIYTILEENELAENAVVSAIPSFPVTSDAVYYAASETVVQEGAGITDLLVYILLAGIAIMLAKLVIQFISLMRMRNNATLLLNGRVKVYQVNKPVIPFSFGNAIYVNTHQHEEAELKEIIRHEFIHVKQRHTIDIVWSELLCVLAWYNPFAWLLRQSVRQNLEFIADQQVLQSGLDKKQYQYLLLRVIGVNAFSIASNFNFSSLKKRIAMMNKGKSARVHLARFLLLLPVLAVILLAFRQNRMAVDAAGATVVTDTCQEKYPSIATLPSATRESPGEQRSTVDATHPTIAADTMPANVKSVQVTNNQVTVTLKNGKTETYNLNDAGEKAAFEKKYGKLPTPPTPPEAPSVKAPASGISNVPVPPTPPGEPDSVRVRAPEAPAAPAAKVSTLQGVPVSPATPGTPVPADGKTPGTPVAPPAGSTVQPPSPVQPPAPSRTGYTMPKDAQSLHMSDSKATITFKSGRKEEYDLTNPAEKAEFDRKYNNKTGTGVTPQKPAPHKSRVPSAGSATTTNNLSGTTQLYSNPSQATAQSQQVTLVQSASTVNSAEMYSHAARKVSTTAAQTNHDQVNIAIKNNNTPEQLKEIQQLLAERGVTLSLEKKHYKNGKLVQLKGTVRAGDDKAAFNVKDFSTLYIFTSGSNDDEERIVIHVMSGGSIKLIR